MTNPILPYNRKLKNRARQLRKNMTQSEVILWNRLKGKQMMGYRFNRQKPIDQYIVYFYCKSLCLIIEVDGSVHNSEAAQQYDQARQAKLETLGLHFLRFTDNEVRYRTHTVCATIANWIKQQHSQKNSPPVER